MTCDQVVRPRTRSAAVGSYLNHLPPDFRNYIVETKNVKADGHCGFRAIADLMGFGEDSWSRVRCDLMYEQSHHTELYRSVFIEHFRTDAVMGVLGFFEDVAPPEHWFTLPEMGYLVATAYNVCFVALTPKQSLTFFPLRTEVPPAPRCICIALVNDNHFIEVHTSTFNTMIDDT